MFRLIKPQTGHIFSQLPKFKLSVMKRTENSLKIKHQTFFGSTFSEVQVLLLVLCDCKLIVFLFSIAAKKKGLILTLNCSTFRFLFPIYYFLVFLSVLWWFPLLA